MDLPLSAAVDYLIYAIEQEKDQAAWDLWCGMYPFILMEQLKPIKFEDFKNKLFHKDHQYSRKTPEEIEMEMLAVVAKYKGR